MKKKYTEINDCIKRYLQNYFRENSIEFNEILSDNSSFDYLGLDSLARVNLMTYLGEKFSLKVDPTAAYDFITIGSLSEFILEKIKLEQFND